jgi:hypothetical protein
MGTALVVGIISAVAAIGTSVYSGVSSHQAQVDQNRAARESRVAAAQAAATVEANKVNATANEAAIAESERISKKRAMASTIKTSAEGVLEAPSVGKEQLGG